MIDLEEGGGHAATVVHAPNESTEIDVERTGGAAAIVEVAGAKTNDGTERLLPGEVRKVNGDVGIWSEGGASGARSGLVLIDEHGTREARAVVTQMPAGGVVIGCASEGASAKNEKVAAMMQEIGNRGPNGFGDDGAQGKDQQTGLRIGEIRGELICTDDMSARKEVGELRGGRGGRIGRWNAGLKPDNRAGKLLCAKGGGSNGEQEQSKEHTPADARSHRGFSQS